MKPGRFGWTVVLLCTLGRAATAHHAADLDRKLLQSPLEFEANQGQFDPATEYVARAARYTVAVRRGTLSISPGAHRNTATRTNPILLNFEGHVAGPATTPLIQSGAYANHLVGNDPALWRTHVPLAERIQSSNLYPGIDLDLYGNQGELEYDLTVAPGADASEIRLGWSGADSVERNEAGELVLMQGAERFTMHAPVAYQVAPDGKRQFVQAAFVLGDKQGRQEEVSFALGTYDHTRALVIDPTLSIAYATYLGGSDYDAAYGITLDASGSVYVTGTTQSSDFPTAHPLQTTGTIFLSKFNPTGTALVYSTYLGGTSGNDEPGSPGNNVTGGTPLAVDSSGSAYLVGTTASLDFPVTTSAFQPTSGSNDPRSGFLLRLSADGSRLLYSSFFGDAISPVSVAADNAGHAYMTGAGQVPDVPLTANAYYRPDPSNYRDYSGILAFVAEFDTTMSGAASLPYSTVFGHISTAGSAIVLDSSGNLVVGGVTGNVFGIGAGTIDIQGGYESGPFNPNTTWIARFNLALGGSAVLVNSTYLGGANYILGGSGGETLGGIAVDGSNNVYVTGTTHSATFPSFRAYEGFSQGTVSGFLTEFNSTLSYLVYSTYIGEDSTFAPSALDVTPAGAAYVAGYAGPGLTQQNAIPGVTPPTVTGGNVSEDAAVLAFAPGGAGELYASYLGTGGGGAAASLVLDSNQNAYFFSSSGTITPTQGALQNTNPSGTAPYLLKLAFTTATTTTIARIQPATGANTGITTLTVHGTAFSTGASLTLNCAGSTITGDIFYISLDGSVLSAYLDLRGAPTGTCDVVVTSGSASSATDAAAFTIEALTNPGVYATIVGPNYIREGTSQVYNIVFGNTGNTDVYAVPLYITFPTQITYSLITPLQYPPQSASGPAIDYSLWPADFPDGNGNTVIGMILPIVRAGSNSSLQIRLTAANTPPTTDDVFDLTVTTQPPWEALNPAPSSGSSNTASLRLPHSVEQDRPILLASLANGAALPLGPGSELFLQALTPSAAVNSATQRRKRSAVRPFDGSLFLHPAIDPIIAQFAKDLLTTPTGKACINDVINIGFQALGLIPGVNCVGGLALDAAQNQINAAVSGNADTTVINSGSGIGPTIAGALYTATGCIPITIPIREVIGAYKTALIGIQAFMDCGKTATNPGGGKLPIGIKGPGDPNFKAGPSGAGALQYIPPTRMLNYNVNFANEPTATASAQNVTATDTLDPTHVDLTTFAFGPIVIGNHVYTPPAGATTLNTQLDLRPDTPYLAQIAASVNPTTGAVTWQFGTIDPATGHPIASSSLGGFLPPDTTEPNGEVAVSFSANLMPGLATGTSVPNSASIVFDGLPAMATNVWTNTIDGSSPSSAVTALPGSTPATALSVSWSGTDTGSGIAGYTIAVSDNGGAFTPWLTATTATSAVFHGAAGHTYGFFSIADDAAGNREGSKTAAEASTTLSLAASTATVTPLTGIIQSNTPVTLTASIAGSPATAGAATGMVTFFDGATSLGTATLNSSGVVSLQVPGFNSGSHSITVTYGGDLNYAGSTSPTYSLTIAGLLTPTVMLAPVPSSLTTTTYGSPVSLLATVTGGGATPTGTVTFSSGNTPLGTVALSSAGTASLTTSATALGVGMANLTATYSGSVVYVAASSAMPVAILVQPAVLTLTAQNASRTYGAQNSAFTGLFTGFAGSDTAAGSVTGTPVLSSSATVASPVGTYAIFPTQGTLAASNYTFVFASGTLTVTPASVTVMANNATRAYGAANPTFTGTLGATQNGDTLTPAYATTAVTLSAPGGYPITPSLTGATLANYAPAFTPGTLTIVKANTTASLTASSTIASTGSAITLTATAQPAYAGATTGTVTFFSGAVSLGSASLNASGLSTLSTTTLGTGQNIVTAVYSGDTDFNPSTSSSITVSVGTPSFSLTSTPTSLTIPGGQSGKAVIATTSAFGFSASVSFSCGTGLPAGMRCTFSPANLLPGASTTLTLAPVISTSGQLAPAGRQSGRFGPLVGATFASLLLLCGGRVRKGLRGLLMLVLGVSLAVAPVGCSDSAMVLPPTTTSLAVTSSNFDTPFGNTLTLSGTLSGSVSGGGGTITFYDGATQLGQAVTPVNGIASLPVASLGIGLHTISAKYSGDSKDAASTSPFVNQVISGTTTLQIVAFSGSITSMTNLQIAIQ